MLQAGMTDKQIRSHFKEQNYTFAGRTVNKVMLYYYTDEVEPLVATRKLLDDSFDEKKIGSITDTGIQKILMNYLAAKGGDPKQAFSPEGMMEMNEHISEYNDGKPHQPILRVRVCEPKGEKYCIGTTKGKDKKFVVAQSGTNLFFAIYETEEGNRVYQTIPLNQAVERLKMGWTPVPEQNENGDKLKFYLSPNDLVYVPTEEETQTATYDSFDKDRIYKLVSVTGNCAFFVKSNIASVIMNKVELLSLNKMERSMDGEMIKSVCWKLEVDRLGNIIKVIR
jgi:CRISPR-associated endonuclease Csn1